MIIGLEGLLFKNGEKLKIFGVGKSGVACFSATHGFQNLLPTSHSSMSAQTYMMDHPYLPWVPQLTTCPVCSHSHREEIESLLLSGEDTLVHVAEKFNVPFDELYEHMKSHVQGWKESSEEEWTAVLEKYLRKLSVKLDRLLSRPLEPSTVKPVVELTKEVRGLVRDLATLSGKIQTTPVIEILQLQSQNQKILEFVMEVLSEDQKRLLLQRLEEAT